MWRCHWGLQAANAKGPSRNPWEGCEGVIMGSKGGMEMIIGGSKRGMEMMMHQGIIRGIQNYLVGYQKRCVGGTKGSNVSCGGITEGS